MRHEGRGDKARNGSPDWHAAHRDNRQGGAQVPRRRLRVDGDHVGNDAADADTRKETQPEHLLEAGGVGGGEGERAEQQVRADQRGLAPITVAHPSEQARTDQDAEQACAEHRAQRRGCHAPVLDQIRRGERDRSDVVAVDQNDEKRPDDQVDLKRAQPALIEQARNLDFRSVRHCFPAKSHSVACLAFMKFMRRAMAGPRCSAQAPTHDGGPCPRTDETPIW